MELNKKPSVSESQTSIFFNDGRKKEKEKKFHGPED